MHDYIWVSAIFASGTLQRGWKVDLLHEGKAREGALLFDNKNGLPIVKEERPQKIWATDYDPPIRKLPTVFNIGYAIVVSEEVKHVFDGFDLGQGDLLPMDEGIYQADQITKYNGNYFSWVVGNKKTAVLLDDTTGKMKLNPRGEVWHLASASSLADDYVAVSRAALEGPDQWVDPLLQSSLFLSRRLGDAIVDAGLKEAFFLYRCRVI